MKTATATPTVFEQLKARCWPLIEAFEADLLVHDRQWLEEYPDTPFLHYTRACGTSLEPLYRTEDLPPAGNTVPYLFGHADREKIARGTVDVARLWDQPLRRPTTRLCLHFDGRRFREITTGQALELARGWFGGLTREWSR